MIGKKRQKKSSEPFLRNEVRLENNGTNSNAKYPRGRRNYYELTDSARKEIGICMQIFDAGEIY